MKTKYKIIKHAIKSKILEGAIVPHQKISSESEMMDQFGVTRHTVRLAIGELVSEGWLYREQGSGTFCADRDAQQNKQLLRPPHKSIAIITTYISEYIFPSLIRGAESYLSEKGYHVSIFNTNNNHEQEKRILETIITGNYQGVLVEPTRSGYANPNIIYYLTLAKLKIPYLMLNATYEELEPISIEVDDVQGGYKQVEHLLKLGHKEIVGLYKTDDAQGKKRLKGYIKAHRAYQVPINPKNIITFNTDEFDEAYQSLERLFNEEAPPTAVAGYNDQLIVLCLDLFRNMGVEIPEDLSVVGFDDSILTEISEVKITSIKHPKSIMGTDAARLIISLIDKQNGLHNKEIESILYDVELIERNSTRRLTDNKEIEVIS
ncbi:GntR family transcriptional regulator [Aquibacillus kalidii]|uniref:GntR family transcriptional regulator n=1 Tax=Aquibacillus kalidii TaxID=2762597 RepID=UPI001648D8C5|nr:GntR family transcriptional regulator [Aquibacillus kalidii]